MPGNETERILDGESLKAWGALTSDDGGHFIRDVVGVFISASNEVITNMRHATEAGDRAELKRLAHKLRGSSSSVGATALANRCSEFEAGVIGGHVDIQAGFRAIEKAFDAVATQLRKEYLQPED